MNALHLTMPVRASHQAEQTITLPVGVGENVEQPQLPHLRKELQGPVCARSLAAHEGSTNRLKSWQLQNLSTPEAPMEIGLEPPRGPGKIVAPRFTRTGTNCLL